MLSMQEALERAIEAERQGAAFYRMVSKMTDDPEAQAFLMEMAGEEEQHAATLLAMARGEQATEVDWSRILAMNETDEAAKASAGSSSATEETMDLREAIEIALESEKHAAYTYACMGAETEGDVQELFTHLALTEQHHAEMLEGLLVKLDAEEA